MPGITVRYEDMENVAHQLTEGQEQIESILKSLDAAVKGLEAGGFVTDSASPRYQASYDEYSSGAKQTIAGLEGMSRYLNKAAAVLRQTDIDLRSGM
jgi:WXG100 family type VII secretion target